MAQELAKQLGLDKVPIAGDDLEYFLRTFSKYSSFLDVRTRWSILWSMKMTLI